jgi:hypothetical protein
MKWIDKGLYLIVLGALISVSLFPSGDANAATWISCTPANIATYDSRVHVKCSAAVGGIQYFAAPTSDSENAARILSVISTARVAGRTLSILYDPADLSGASYGCLTDDCRPIIAVAF